MDDVNISGCKFSADIVPYMYGEMAVTESSAFESHLLDCGACTDEFALVSNARYEVYDWKKLEFDPLPTPHFNIADVEHAGVLGVAAWLGKVRAAFGQSWLIPTASFAAIAIVAVFGATFLLSGDNQQEVAQSNSNTPATAVSVPAITTAESKKDDLEQPSNIEPRPVSGDIEKQSGAETVCSDRSKDDGSAGDRNTCCSYAESEGTAAQRI
jgi:hypothetical protein